ncbi:family 3 adenylate cyclase [Mycobacteroides abscessus subsp. abscessus]|nr:family 3 adenylate cyclase [Mycobacteroides abscessus subsp. abscessus]
MGFQDDCESAVSDIIRTEFNTRSGREVPTTDSIVQRDGAVWLTAAYLYADMADSTGLATHFVPEDAARIIRAYLAAVCKVLRERGGEIRSFDGDRVMAIFAGDDAADKAVDAGLRINWVVRKVVHPQLLLWSDAYYDKSNDGKWSLKHRTGIDVGTALIVRAGVRGHNDLVSVGDAPNIAAKLSDYKGGGATIISNDVWEKLSYKNCFSKDSLANTDEEQAIWTQPTIKDIGGGTWESIRTSTWLRSY